MRPLPTAFCKSGQEVSPSSRLNLVHLYITSLKSQLGIRRAVRTCSLSGKDETIENDCVPFHVYPQAADKQNKVYGAIWKREEEDVGSALAGNEHPDDLLGGIPDERQRCSHGALITSNDLLLRQCVPCHPVDPR